MYYVGVILGAVTAGILVGLIPFFLAKKKGLKTLGIVGLLACVLANFIIGLLGSIPVCIVFVIIIVVKKAPDVPSVQQDVYHTAGNIPQAPNQAVTGPTNGQWTAAPNAQNSACPYCGAQVEDGGIYCPGCGRKIK